MCPGICCHTHENLQKRVSKCIYDYNNIQPNVHVHISAILAVHCNVTKTIIVHRA